LTSNRQRSGSNKGGDVSAEQSLEEEVVNNGIQKICHSIVGVKTYIFSNAASAV
jgi:hypothetical protein